MEMEKLQLSLNSLVCLGTPSFPGHLLLNIWHLSAKLRKHCISLSYIYSETSAEFFCSHDRKGFCEAPNPYKQHALKCTLAFKSFMFRTILCVLGCSTVTESQWSFYFEPCKDPAHILECVLSHKVTQRYLVPLDTKQRNHFPFSVVSGHCAWKALDKMAGGYYPLRWSTILQIQLFTFDSAVDGNWSKSSSTYPLQILAKSGQVCF